MQLESTKSHALQMKRYIHVGVTRTHAYKTKEENKILTVAARVDRVARAWRLGGAFMVFASLIATF